MLFRLCCSSNDVAVSSDTDLKPKPKEERGSIGDTTGDDALESTPVALINMDTRIISLPEGKRNVPAGTGAIRTSKGDVVREIDILREGHRENYEYMNVIGTGSFGYVLRVRNKLTNKYYAMKLMSYQDTVDLLTEEEQKSSGDLFWWPFKKKKEKDEDDNLLNMEKTASARNILRCTSVQEEAIMDRLNHCFIVTLFDDFHTETTLYMIMELIEGTTLSQQCTMANNKLPEDQSKRWLAQLLLAVEYIHYNGIVHRDLKPDNIMISAVGCVKVMDLGLAFDADHHKSKRCLGARGYKAPEMQAGSKYTYSVDWWNYGVIAFELLVGKHPFKHQDNKARSNKPVWPSKFKEKNPLAADFVTKLLERDPVNRLGCSGELGSDATPIKDHPFFDSIDWREVLAEGNRLRFERKVVFDTNEKPQFEDYGALKKHIQNEKARLEFLVM